MKKTAKFFTILAMVFLLFACAGGDDDREDTSDPAQITDTKQIDDDKDGYTENDGDCNDSNPGINPGEPEICGDGIDQDCDGLDLQCQAGENDTDDDNDGFTENQGDCNDNNEEINPGANEICGDGKDQNCDGKDVSCQPVDPNNMDDDKDGFTENQGDCDDTNAGINPQATEICSDKVDQDCDGKDLVCPSDVPSNNVDDDKDGFTENQGDCNDENDSIYPGANEICGDEIDQDCDGKDLECPPQNDTDDTDNDKDGFTENQGDCDDTNRNIYPNAIEVCGDLIDQDCNGNDLPCPNEPNPYDIDDDGDGFTENQGDCNDYNTGISPIAEEICEDGVDQDCNGSDLPCSPQTDPKDTDDDKDNFSENQGDCDDNNAGINPDAEEICGDNIDQDCSGEDLACPPQTDADDDGDGFNEAQGDCNDSNAGVYPGAVEICGDGIDQDCNGIDLSCPPVDPKDIDDDGDGYSENQGDCDDSNADINPGAEEICDDGIDQDCNGIDLTCTPSDPNNIDNDGDGYSENQGDCDDSNADINPGAEEICGDGIDQDCDGIDTCGTDTVNDFAQNYEQSSNNEDISLFMQRISQNYLDNGVTYSCQQEIRTWFFGIFDYANTSFQINDVSYETRNGVQFAIVNSTISYDQISGNGQTTQQSTTQEIVLILEDGIWKSYGNQLGYSSPNVLQFVTCSSINGNGDPEGIKNEFTSNDDSINIFVSLNNIGNGSTLRITTYKPDGSQFDNSPFLINWGTFPDCARSQIKWHKTHMIVDLSEYGVESDFGADDAGTWRVVLSMDGVGILDEISFQYNYLGR